MVGTIIGNVDGIRFGINVVTDIGSLDGSFDGSNDGKQEGLFIGDSLGSNDGKVIGSDEGINCNIMMLTCLSLYLELWIESHLGLILEQSWALKMDPMRTYPMEILRGY